MVSGETHAFSIVKNSNPVYLSNKSHYHLIFIYCLTVISLFLFLSHVNNVHIIIIILEQVLFYYNKISLMSQLNCHLSHIQLCICVGVIYCISIDSLSVGLERMGMNGTSLKKTL